MGWQDAPIVGAPASTQPKWASAPIVGETSAVSDAAGRLATNVTDAAKPVPSMALGRAVIEQTAAGLADVAAAAWRLAPYANPGTAAVEGLRQLAGVPDSPVPDELHRWANDRRVAGGEMAAASSVPGADLIAQATGQLATAIPTILATGPAAPVVFGAQQYSRALTEGKDAGLSGLRNQGQALLRGGIETGTTMAFNVAGKFIPGMAGLDERQVFSTLREGLKKTGIRFTSEIAEENAIELQDAVVAKLSGANLQALDDPWGIITQTTALTAVTMGLAEAPRATSHAARALGLGYEHSPEYAAKWAQTHPTEAQELAKKVAEGKPLSRTTFDALGLPATIGRDKRAEFAGWVMAPVVRQAQARSSEPGAGFVDAMTQPSVAPQPTGPMRPAQDAPQAEIDAYTQYQEAAANAKAIDPEWVERKAKRDEKLGPMQPQPAGRNADFVSAPSLEQVQDAISEDKRGKVGLYQTIEPGRPVGLRIDIPAFERKGVYVVTVHDQAKGGKVGKTLSYEPTARVANPKFWVLPSAEQINQGRAKFPAATVEGQWISQPLNQPAIPEDIDSWTPVGFNPAKEVFFYDKQTGREVTGGAEAISVGNTVFVKAPQYGERQSRWHGPSAADKNTSTSQQESVNLSKASDPREKPKAGFKKRATVNLSAATPNLPPLAALDKGAKQGDQRAVEDLHKVTTRTLRHFLEKEGVSPELVTVKVTGLYDGAIEPSQSIDMEYDAQDEAKVVRAIQGYAAGLTQQQIHAREDTTDPLDTVYNDGSYVTPVYTFQFAPSDPVLTQADIQKVLESAKDENGENGLYGLTYGERSIEAYYVKNPYQTREQFHDAVTRAFQKLAGDGRGYSAKAQRLWAYGTGDGGIGWPGAGSQAGNNQLPGQAEPTRERSRAARKNAKSSFRDRQGGPDPKTVVGVHYSDAPRDELLGERYGTGLKGAERKLIENAVYMRGEYRLWRRSYFYIKDGDTLPKKEAGVGEVPHEKTFTNIYIHGVSKPLDYEAGQFESAVIDAGYDGYAVPEQGGMVLLDVKPIPVAPIKQKAEPQAEEYEASIRGLSRDEKRKLLGKELSDAMLDEEVDAIGPNSLPIVFENYKKLKYLDQHLRDLIKVGENAHGGYEEGARLVSELIGPQRAKLWALLNSAFSAQNAVAKHTVAGLDLALRVSEFIDKNGRVPNHSEARGLFDETIRDTDSGNVATDTVHWPKSWAVIKKGYDATFEDLKSIAKTNKTGHSIAKVPGFGRSSGGDVVQVVLDTYMARLIKPSVSGFKYVEGKRDREGNVLSRGQQLKESQKSWISRDNNYLAYSAKIRQIANEFGLKAGQAQERIWASVYSILGLKNAGVPVEELTHADIRAAWNLSELLLESENVRRVLERHGIEESAIEAVRAQAADIAKQYRPSLQGKATGGVSPGFRRLSAQLKPTGQTEGREVSKRFSTEVDEGDTSFNVEEFTGDTAATQPTEQPKAGLRRRLIYTKKRWAPWASSPPQTSDGARLAREQKKPDTTVGERTVAEFLADALSATIVRTKSQLTKSSPGKYLGGFRDKNGKPLIAPFHHIWLRSEAGYWHELGHALSSVFSHVDYQKYQKWQKFWEPALTQLSNSQNGFSSVPGSLEEGVAEAARLYITDQGRLDAIKLKNSKGKTISFLEGMDEILGSLAPEEYKAMKDAHRLMAAHRQKPQAEQKKIHSRDKGYQPGDAGRRLRDAVRAGWEKVLASVYGDSATIDRIAAKAFETQSQTSQSGWHGIAGMMKQINPFLNRAQRQANKQSLDQAKQADAKLASEIGDLKARYNTLARTGVEVQRILKGDDGQKGLRVMGTKDMLFKRFGKNWRVAISRLKQSGIPMNFAESKEGEYYYFVDDQGNQVKSVAEIKEEVGKDSWADFESYGKWKTVLHRYKIYERRKAQGKDVEEPLHPDWTEHPIYPEKNRPGVSVQELVDDYERQHPEWKKSYKDVQLLMDGLLGMAVLSGEIDYKEARRIKRNHRNYWPLGRQQREQVGEGRLDPRDIGYDIKKQYSSDLPFNGLDEMLYGRVHKALSAYNYARLLESHVALARAMAKLEPELRKKVSWMRTFIPLKVDMKVGAILSPEEEAKIVAERINLLEARRMGLPLDQYLQQYGGVTPDDVRISSPGRILWREAAPNIQANVMSVTKGHKKNYYYVPDPLTVDIYTSQPHLLGDIPGLSTTFEMLGRIIAPFKRIVTRSMPFAILNTFWRDPQTAMLSGQGKRSLIPYLYLARGLKAVIKRDILGTASPTEIEALQETWSTFSKTSIPVHLTLESFKGMMSEGITHIDGTPLKFRPSEVGYPEAAKSWAGAAVSTIMKPFDLVNWATGGWYLSPRGEALGRIGAYLDAMDNGMTQEQAIMAGDNSTANFNQRSKSRWINAVDKQAMFLNARMQVGWTFYRQLRDPDPRVRGLALMKLPYIAGMHSLLLASLYLALRAFGDEEDEKKLAEWLKSENDRTDEDKLRFGSIPFLNIKVPFDDGLPGMFASMGWNATLKALNGENPHKEALRIAGESAGNMGPVISQWINPYVRTIMEIKMNYNFYHGEPIVPPGVSSLHEPRQQSLPSTPEFYNWFAENVMNVSPLKLRHVVSNVGARALDQTLAFNDEKVPQEKQNLPVFGSLFTKEPRGWSSQPVKELSELESQFDAAKKDLEKIAASDPQRAEEAYKRMQALAGYKAGWSAVEAIWRQAKAYRKAGNMEMATQREREMTAVARRLLLQAAESTQ